jgi:hypothetical protein
MTVGTLPSAVYWRRRVTVLVAVMVAGTIAWASCASSGGSDGKKKPASAKGSPSAATSPPASTAGSLLPQEGESTAVPSGPPPQGTPASAGPGDDHAATTCVDGDLLVTPVPESASAPRGQAMRITIKIRNITGRACSRDVGPDQQELYLLRDGSKVYSSDACDARHGTSIRSLAPGVDLAFWVSWDGTATASGCTGRQAPPAGKYQLVGRLGAKTSDPVTLTLG